MCFVWQASFPAPPTGRKYTTFSHIFGSNTSSLETFLLERKIKGPCWLEVKQPENVQAKVSWCKLEASCDKMENISVLRDDNDLEAPPITVATVSIYFTFTHRHLQKYNNYYLKILFGSLVLDFAVYILVYTHIFRNYIDQFSCLKHLQGVILLTVYC